MPTNATSPAPSALIKFGGSLSKNRRWALIASYASLVVFAIFFQALSARRCFRTFVTAASLLQPYTLPLRPLLHIRMQMHVFIQCR